MKIKKILNLFIAVAAISSCTLEPNYKRPQPPVPLDLSESPAKKKPR